MTSSTSPKSPSKPAKPVANLLKNLWWAWLFCRLVCYPTTVAMVSGVGLGWGMAWQMLAMLPALLFTPAVVRGNAPYALLWLSMVMLVYLGVVGVMAFMRFYESASMMIWLVLFLEFGLIFAINVALFMLLKRLPAWHKTLQNAGQSDEI